MIRPLIRSTVLALLAGTALAAQPGPRGPHPAPFPLGVLCGLELSEGQRTSLRALLDKHRPARLEKQKALGQAERVLGEAMMEPATTDARLRELHRVASEARLALLLEDRAVLLEARALLTPDQQAKIKAQPEPFQREMEGHPGPMGEPGPPPMP